MRRLLTMAAAALLLVSCGRTTVSSNTLPPIFPDYADVTIPAQIAPMNFNLMNGAKRVYVRVRGTKGGEMNGGITGIHVQLAEEIITIPHHKGDEVYAFVVIIMAGVMGTVEQGLIEN